MIGRLRGVLVHKQPPFLLLEVQGVGYELEASMQTFFELPAPGQDVTLHTHLVVKEDAHKLYGFLAEQERALFRSLIRVSGVGPKLALTVLSGIRAEDFIRCLELEDTSSLTRLPGVGKKTAERLLIEMRDRIKELMPTTTGMGQGRLAPRADDPASEAVSALVALGYKPAEATRLAANVQTDGLSSEQIIRLALQKALK
jgi:holliday junction DNA helicase RuvA